MRIKVLKIGGLVKQRGPSIFKNRENNPHPHIDPNPIQNTNDPSVVLKRVKEARQKEVQKERAENELKSEQSRLELKLTEEQQDREDHNRKLYRERLANDPAFRQREREAEGLAIRTALIQQTQEQHSTFRSLRKQVEIEQKEIANEAITRNLITTLYPLLDSLDSINVLREAKKLNLPLPLTEENIHDIVKKSPFPPEILIRVIPTIKEQYPQLSDKTIENVEKVFRITKPESYNEGRYLLSEEELNEILESPLFYRMVNIRHRMDLSHISDKLDIDEEISDQKESKNEQQLKVLEEQTVKDLSVYEKEVRIQIKQHLSSLYGENKFSETIVNRLLKEVLLKNLSFPLTEEDVYKTVKSVYPGLLTIEEKKMRGQIKHHLISLYGEEVITDHYISFVFKKALSQGLLSLLTRENVYEIMKNARFQRLERAKICEQLHQYLKLRNIVSDGAYYISGRALSEGLSFPLADEVIMTLYNSYSETEKGIKEQRNLRKEEKRKQSKQLESSV